ncbi:MAG: DUF4124 domain-containing protein [Oceanococcus sp.]
MRPLFLAVLMLLSFVVSADNYRWVDDNGRVHYGDQPPVGAKRLKAPPGPANATSQSEDDKPSPTSDIDKGVYKTASFEEICKELNSRVANYRSSPNMAMQGEDGEPRALSAKERLEFINKTQTQADAACKRAKP